VAIDQSVNCSLGSQTIDQISGTRCHDVGKELSILRAFATIASFCATEHCLGRFGAALCKTDVGRAISKFCAGEVSEGAGPPNSLIFGGSKLLDKFDDRTPQLCVWNLHESFGEVERVRRGEIV
jgi:hypothetical protein